MAGQIPASDVLERLRKAREDGATRVTLLGGEPTLQRSFIEVLTECTSLGFEEIIIFTNGVMASKGRYLDRILALGEFTWRFSLQGANETAHDAVTQNRGSFERITAGIRAVRAAGQRVSTNLCVTAQNVSSLPDYPAMVNALDVQDVHLDMVRPLDAGDRSPEYLRSILPRYRVIADEVEGMLQRFPPRANAHVGNLPFCVLPNRAYAIFHDGVQTRTFAANGHNGIDDGWDKYETKRRDKHYLESCAECVFRNRCNGIFETYLEAYGEEEFKPILAEELWTTMDGQGAFHFLMETLRPALSRGRDGLVFTLNADRQKPEGVEVVAQFKNQDTVALWVTPRDVVRGQLEFGLTQKLACHPARPVSPNSKSILSATRALLGLLADEIPENKVVRNPQKEDVQAWSVAKRQLMARVQRLETKGYQFLLSAETLSAYCTLWAEEKWLDVRLVQGISRTSVSYTPHPDLERGEAQMLLTGILG